MVLAQPCRFAARRDRDAPPSAAAAGGEGDRASIVLGPPWESQSFFPVSMRVRPRHIRKEVCHMSRSGADRTREYRERLRAQAELARDRDEQAVRERFGYAASEDRSTEERQATADRIMAKFGGVTLDPRVRYMIQAESGARLVSHTKGESKEQTRLRVARARSYAEWRWDGFHAGEIASL